MRATLYAVALFLTFAGEASAACTPEMIANLRARGASPALIAKICGSYAPASAPTRSLDPAPSSTCTTSLGVCSYNGGANEPCTCTGPLGKASGVSH